jgi:hypothetical protein
LAILDEFLKGGFRREEMEDPLGNVNPGQDKILLGDQFGTGLRAGWDRRQCRYIASTDILFENTA